MPTAADFRAAGLRLPGPCEEWADDAGFIRGVVDRVGDKWTVLVIGTLGDGPRRYTDLQQAIPGISQRMLTLTLKHLTRDGLVERTAYPEVPPRVEYALTGLGQSLLSSVLALARWAYDHRDDIRTHRATFDRTNTA
ncbi:winged helix-turn-helix transcriptional regulator [Asanoa siamensis]|uniref:winged helix-turn-helix transcriptional regulator n=1 Tax=Asanoa siamensis TaxID=926357 RepID=UPI00194293E2|nr:helix-turn-helix domain-containing protein [Asanoa siamensis]